MSSSLGAALKGAQEYPDEDSEDLTDEEISEAVHVEGPTGIVDYLAGMQCRTCSDKLRVREHVLRRRKPHLYWRVTLVCEQQHQQSTLFLTDWV